MNRRGFLGAMLAAAAAPAIARASSLMPVVPVAPEVWTPPDTIYTGEIGSYESIRFIESAPVDHAADALRYGLYGVGMASMVRPFQRRLNRDLVGRMQDLLARAERIEAPRLYVHPQLAHDLRARGYKVHKQ
jgi:hypothetical protein